VLDYRTVTSAIIVAPLWAEDTSTSARNGRYRQPYCRKKTCAAGANPINAK